MSRKLPTKATSGVHFIYPKLRDRVVSKTCFIVGIIVIPSRHTSHSQQYSMPITLSGCQGEVELVVTYNSLKALGTLQFHQALPLFWSYQDPSSHGRFECPEEIDCLFIPLDQSDQKPSVYMISDWPVRVACLSALISSRIFLYTLFVLAAWVDCLIFPGISLQPVWAISLAHNSGLIQVFLLDH